MKIIVVDSSSTSGVVTDIVDSEMERTCLTCTTKKCAHCPFSKVLVETMDLGTAAEVLLFTSPSLLIADLPTLSSRRLVNSCGGRVPIIIWSQDPSPLNTNPSRSLVHIPKPDHLILRRAIRDQLKKQKEAFNHLSIEIINPVPTERKSA